MYRKYITGFRPILIYVLTILFACPAFSAQAGDLPPGLYLYMGDQAAPGKDPAPQPFAVGDNGNVIWQPPLVKDSKLTSKIRKKIFRAFELLLAPAGGASSATDNSGQPLWFHDASGNSVLFAPTGGGNYFVNPMP